MKNKNFKYRGIIDSDEESIKYQKAIESYNSETADYTQRVSYTIHRMFEPGEDYNENSHTLELIGSRESILDVLGFAEGQSVDPATEAAIIRLVDINKRFNVSYRGEFETAVDALNEDEAVCIAERSKNWSFILGEGHKDMFEVSEEKD